MRFLNILLLLFIIKACAFSQVNLSGTSVVFDSLTAQPLVPSATKEKVFSKGEGLYMKNHAGSTHRIDSLTVLPEFSKNFIWPSWTATDSTLFWVPASAYTVDSIKVRQVGATSVTFRAGRRRGGSYAQFFASTYTCTGNMVVIPSITNNTLAINDTVFIVVASISGTATSIDLQFDYHF